MMAAYKTLTANNQTIRKSDNYFCPPVINDAFVQENYYFSSLGNSITFDKRAVHQLEKLIKKRKIKEISFVLSNDNRIVLDALGNQNFSNVKGLSNFYKKVTPQRDQIGLS